MSPETIDAMLAAGVTAEVLAAAWKAEIAKQEETLTERRTRDAERQRRHRESRDVTVTDCDSADPAPLEVSPGNPLPNSPNQVFAPLNPPAPEVILEEKKQAIAACLKVAFPSPDGVSSDQWAAFRSQRKKALSPRSYLLICNKLKTLADAGWPPGDMIDLAIERGWETVFEPRNQANGQSASNITSLRGSRPDPALDLLRAARAAEDREAHRGAGTTLPAIRPG